jgi:hypothetical protein
MLICFKIFEHLREISSLVECFLQIFYQPKPLVFLLDLGKDIKHQLDSYSSGYVSLLSGFLEVILQEVEMIGNASFRMTFLKV